MSTPAANPSSNDIKRINQVYHAYLNTSYEIDYYREKHVRLANRSKHIDFLIALGAAASGGSGLGILATPQFVWLCVPLTTISTIGALAKGTYDWSGKLNKYLEMIEFHAPIFHEFRSLKEDIQPACAWNDSFEQRYTAIRDKSQKVPIDLNKDLPVKVRRKIQDEIKDRENYQEWWAWQDA